MVSETNASGRQDDQKLSEDMEDSAAYVENLLQFLYQPLYYANHEGILVRGNKALAELTGYKIEELTGNPTSLLFADKEEFLKMEGETIKRGEVKPHTLAILTREKKEVPVSISTSLRQDKEENVTGYFAVLSNLVEKQTQARIEQAAREWRATMDAITDLVWICDKDCQLLRVNRAYAEAAGMEPKQLIGKTCYSVSTWIKELCDRCPHKHTMASKESSTEEFFSSQKGVYLEISASPIFDDNGEVVASVCIARDVTERKQADKQIQSLSRLRQYFSPKLAQRLISDEDIYKVRRKNLTIFFTDIRGFSSISDKAEPEELMDMLNEYFTEMTQIIFNWGGTVCKFIGDGIMGFFGDPEENLNHAELAVKMALEMQAKVKSLNEKSLHWGDFPLAIGIGIDTGYVTIGHVGPENHRDYTVIGRYVNIAARLVDEAKPGQVLIGQRTYRMIAGVVKAEEIGYISVKGFDKPVLVYNVLGLV